MSEDDTLIVSPKRIPFIMLPLMVDDLGLSPYAMRLYVRLVRRAGWNGGECWENTEHMAEACKMAKGSVTKAKNELAEAGLITIALQKRAHGEFPYHVITLSDIWLQNMQKYQQNDSEDSTRSPSEQERSLHEQERSPSERKNIPIKKGRGKKYPRASRSLPPFLPAKQEVGNSGAASPSLLSNPIIQGIHEVTGYYPRHALIQRIINAHEKRFGNQPPDILGMKKVYETWIANGYNPMDTKGWFFDWYLEDMYYVDPGKKFKDSE